MGKRKNRLIKDVGEFGLINWIRKNSIKSREIITGIGDDVAEINYPSEKDLIITTDTLQEGIHYNSKFADPEIIGRRFLRVNLSDIAASGGTAHWCVMTAGLNKTLSFEWFKKFMKGFFKELKNFRIFLVGGDIVETPHKNYFSLTLFGTAPAGGIIPRCGATPGDVIFVTGTIGDSSAGLKLLEEYGRVEKIPEGLRWLAKRHLLPEPRLETGRMLADRKIPSAMIDISDGLLQDLGHILDESDCGCIIYSDKIPLSEQYRRFCKINNNDLWTLVFSGGEDYELLFTVSKDNLRRLFSLKNNLNCSLTEIGVITKEKTRIIYNGDRKKKLVFEGYQHFRN